MTSLTIHKLVEASRGNASLLTTFLTDPEKAAASLGIALSAADLQTLQAATNVMVASSQGHDHEQARIQSQYILFAVFASFPGKKPRKKPGTPKRPKKPKPS